MVNQYKLLVDSLKLLGLSYEEQERFLPNYADIKDDVVSEFVNAFYLVPQLMEKNELSYQSVTKVLYCYVLLEMNLSIEERATDLAFKTHESWEQVRDMAQKALAEMGESIESPSIDSFDFKE